MNDKYRISRRQLFNILFTFLIIYFGFHSILGNRGINSYFKLSNQITKSYLALSELRSERIEIEHKTTLLKSGSNDIIDEYAKDILALAKSKEKVFTVTSQ